jgi:hypothetical protein
MTLRIIQWTTGNVGLPCLRAIAAHPELELVGCYAWSDEKVGRDAGELAGIAPTGVLATNDVEALIALEPDCISYNPKWTNTDELVRFLEAGINVASTAGFITGHSLPGDDRERIERACRQGGASMFGSGVNPGFANLLALVSAGICDRIDRVSVLESADSTGYDSPETELPVGFAQPITNQDLPNMVRSGTAVFQDAVQMMADALHVELDEIVCESDFAVAPEDLDLGYMKIPEGCVAGIEAHWLGRVDGQVVIDLGVRWRKGPRLEPDWELDHGYRIEIEGRPCVKTKLEMRPPADFEAKRFSDFMQLGMIATGMPAVNAIPAVCAAAPGIRTYADLPLVTGAGLVRAGR